MKSLILILLAITLVFGQAPSKSKPKAQSKKEQPRERDPEDRWICRIGSYHDCHCPAMVAEAQDEAIREGNKIPNECEIIQKADAKHPEHTCKRTCQHAKCQCWDGPPCAGPEVYHPDNSSDEVNR